MKADGCPTGISNNPNARQRFFLATTITVLKVFQKPVLFCTKQSSCPPQLFPGKVKREHGTITIIKEAIAGHGNPVAVPSTTFSRMNNP